MKKKRKPKFNVLNLGKKKSVKPRWRKPRGTHNKKRMKFKWAGKSPKVGYKNHESSRGLHSSGKMEVLVNNARELEGLKEVLVRIAAGVGARKRKEIGEKAKALNLRILNMPNGVARVKFAAKPSGKKGAST